jgi:hypothetical protein
MTMLFFIAAVIAGFGLWWYLSNTREAALAAAQRHCREMGVQLLDGSVMANGLQLIRNRSGSLVLLQKFRFEFTSTGEQRYSGRAELVGRRVLKMELEPHRV